MKPARTVWCEPVKQLEIIRLIVSLVGGEDGRKRDDPDVTYPCGGEGPGFDALVDGLSSDIEDVGGLGDGYDGRKWPVFGVVVDRGGRGDGDRGGGADGFGDGQRGFGGLVKVVCGVAEHRTVSGFGLGNGSGVLGECVKDRVNVEAGGNGCGCGVVHGSPFCSCGGSGSWLGGGMTPGWGHPCWLDFDSVCSDVAQRV